jgi:hypothetical protein
MIDRAQGLPIIRSDLREKPRRPLNSNVRGNTQGQVCKIASCTTVKFTANLVGNKTLPTLPNQAKPSLYE